MACYQSDLGQFVYSLPFTLEIKSECQDPNQYRIYEQEDFFLRLRQFEGEDNTVGVNFYTQKIFKKPVETCSYERCHLVEIDKYTGAMVKSDLAKAVQLKEDNYTFVINTSELTEKIGFKFGCQLPRTETWIYSDTFPIWIAPSCLNRKTYSELNWNTTPSVSEYMYSGDSDAAFVYTQVINFADWVKRTPECRFEVCQVVRVASQEAHERIQINYTNIVPKFNQSIPDYDPNYLELRYDTTEAIDADDFLIRCFFGKELSVESSPFKVEIIPNCSKLITYQPSEDKPEDIVIHIHEEDQVPATFQVNVDQYIRRPHELCVFTKCQLASKYNDTSDIKLVQKKGFDYELTVGKTKMIMNNITFSCTVPGRANNRYYGADSVQVTGQVYQQVQVWPACDELRWYQRKAFDFS